MWRLAHLLLLTRRRRRVVEPVAEVRHRRRRRRSRGCVVVELLRGHGTVLQGIGRGVTTL